MITMSWSSAVDSTLKKKSLRASPTRLLLIQSSRPGDRLNSSLFGNPASLQRSFNDLSRLLTAFPSTRKPPAATSGPIFARLGRICRESSPKKRCISATIFQLSTHKRHFVSVRSVHQALSGSLRRGRNFAKSSIFLRTSATVASLGDVTSTHR